MIEGTYTIKVYCQNCGYEGTHDIVKGISIQVLNSQECPSCGCKELKSLGQFTPDNINKEL